MQTNSRPGWLVVNARPNQEHIALANLRRQDFEPYCPMVGKLVRHARKSEVKARPLFPGYLFVRWNSTRGRWRTILSTVGVRQLVRFGDHVALIDEHLIDGFRQNERDGLIVAPDVRYAVGQRVEINRPAFDGVIGKILAIDESSRITVLIDMMHRGVKMKLTADVLVPVTDGQ